VGKLVISYQQGNGNPKSPRLESSWLEWQLFSAYFQKKFFIYFLKKILYRLVFSGRVNFFFPRRDPSPSTCYQMLRSGCSRHLGARATAVTSILFSAFENRVIMVSRSAPSRFFAGLSSGRTSSPETEGLEIHTFDPRHSAPFKLSPKFVGKFKEKQPPFGFNGLGGKILPLITRNRTNVEDISSYTCLLIFLI